MTSATKQATPPLGPAEYVILGLHALAGLGLGIAGMVSGTNGNGFSDLASVVSWMLAVAWWAGVAVSWLAARYATGVRWVRFVIVTIGPLVGLVILVVVARG